MRPLNIRAGIVALLLLFMGSAFAQSGKSDQNEFRFLTEQFADLRIIRYQIPDWDKLSLRQKKLVYYLSEAGYSGRDIMYDQNYRHNLKIRRALEKIVRDYKGDRSSQDWEQFMIYAKRVWFSNGIHHHYSNDKIQPGFSDEYFHNLMEASGVSLDYEVVKAIFDPTTDAKKVNLDPDKGLVKGSAVNFYAPDITEEEVDAYYAGVIDKSDKTPVEYGLNTKLVRDAKGGVREVPYKIGGMYGPALERVAYWLKQARTVAENDRQAEALGHLIEYYETGDLEKWTDFNVAWVDAKDVEIDFINGFVEVYNDPKGYKGSYETIVEIKDFDMTDKMQVLDKNVQWFEDHSPIMDDHKKENVVGVSYKVVNVAGESGDASPSTPIGVNLPNSNWIRANHGSKSVSLGNIVYAYGQSRGSGRLKEFANDEDEIARAEKYGKLASKLHTALHEVVGHASGQLEEGVGTPKETLKNYSSTIEEGRADLVALYFLYDQKLIDIGLMPGLDVGKTEYDSYIRNGLLTQLVRIEPGRDIEEAHMRNRAWISRWVFEKGSPEGVISRVERNGKTYYDIQDYDRLKELFGELLQEVQRIKSQGDYEAAKELVENYGVKVDPEIHKEVLERNSKMKSAAYGGFINPRLVPVKDASGEISDIKVEYPDDFTSQMLEYADKYSFLPDEN